MVTFQTLINVISCFYFSILLQSYGEEAQYISYTVRYTGEKMDTLLTCKALGNTSFIAVTFEKISNPKDSINVNKKEMKKNADATYWNMTAEEYGTTLYGSYWIGKIQISRNISTRSIEISFDSTTAMNHRFQCLAGIKKKVVKNIEKHFTHVPPKVLSVAMFKTSGETASFILPGEEIIVKCNVMLGYPENQRHIIKLESPGNGSRYVQSDKAWTSITKFTIREYKISRIYSIEDDQKEVLCSSDHMLGKSERKKIINVIYQPQNTKISILSDSLFVKILCQSQGNPTPFVSIQLRSDYENTNWTPKNVSGFGRAILSIPPDSGLGNFMIFCQSRNNLNQENIKAKASNVITLL